MYTTICNSDINVIVHLMGEIYVKISKNRTARKQQQIEENQFFEDSEGLLYGPRIAD